MMEESSPAPACMRENEPMVLQEEEMVLGSVLERLRRELQSQRDIAQRQREQLEEQRKQAAAVRTSHALRASSALPACLARVRRVRWT